MVYDKKSIDSNIISNIPQIDELKEIKEQLMFYVKENERLVNELRNSRHNALNILQGINGYIELQDWDGLKEYFYDILERSRNISNRNISSIEKIVNSSLKKLLESKLKDASDEGINVKVMVDESILVEESIICESDLCKVIGEFLDNAIEGASMASSKKLSIYILNNEEAVSIIIENTFKEKPNIGLNGAEPKDSDYGKAEVKLARTILSQYPNVLNNTFIQHNVFVQEIQIIK